MNKLIELYCAICHHSEDSRIAEKMQHGSNNKSAQFTDVELMTAYLWGAQQGLLTRKSIYNFIRTYHLGEFQKLPSYQAFCRRLNRLAEAFAALAEVLFEQKLASSEPTHGYVLDSCPVMVSVGSRSNTAKTARNLCNLTRNPTKNLWYHGVKLHVFAQLRPRKLPIPCAVQISKASLCDLWAAKQIDLDCAPGHRRPTLCRSCLYRRRMEIPSANRAERRAHHAAKAEKVRCSCFRRCRVHPHQCPAAAD